MTTSSTASSVLGDAGLVVPDAVWLARSSLDVARGLLGAELRTTTAQGSVTVRLTEVEAYCGSQDPGSHAYRGRTARNATMFGPAGRLYVYFSYGMHWCANLVTGTEGTASAVLLRAGEVIDGVELARLRRPTSRADRDLASGPARLATALGLSGSDDGAALEGSDVVNAREDRSTRVSLRVPVEPVDRWQQGPRTGVSGAGGSGLHYPWRFWVTGDPTVSRYRAA